MASVGKHSQKLVTVASRGPSERPIKPAKDSNDINAIQQTSSGNSITFGKPTQLEEDNKPDRTPDVTIPRGSTRPSILLPPQVYKIKLSPTITIALKPLAFFWL